LKELLERGLVSKSGSAYTIVSALFEDFLRRQQQVQEQIPDGLWIDHEAGDVWVNGQETEHLTELEFKLLTLLTERRNKLTDKFQIVETVWGVAYIDQVDDARIETLVSRLRAKVEPDPGSPRFIHTVRGRGYRLVPEGQNGV
jgi:two-component system response regulator RegX3